MHSFWDFVWYMVMAFVFIAYLIVLFQIVVDLFRDHELSGWWKAVWILGLIAFPILVALIYLIARGNGMAKRQLASAQVAQQNADAYIKSVAGAGSSPAEQIAQAKSLLDSGAISEEEFAQLKSKALTS